MEFMDGQKFQYDESGGTFYHFILSFSVLVLIPSTYYGWPCSDKIDAESESKSCQCPGCRKKKLIIQKNEQWKILKNAFIKLSIFVGWALVLLLVYKVSQFDYEYSNFDPYEILGVPFSSSKSIIRKAYRRLSLVLHPDKETGSQKAFMKLTRAYQSLTDDESRKNWERYGNPDGPGSMSFGIALPSCIVQKENSFLVLGLYALAFMVALPFAVGTWWYKSIRYSVDKVLLETITRYCYFLQKTPSMDLRRVIMVLGASSEFEKKHSSDIVERESDEFEMPKLISQLHNLEEKNRERPLCFKYALKARALIHAHLSRIPLSPKTLDLDRMTIIRKSPLLIQEMINCITQLTLLAYAGRVPWLVTIETLENCMKLCPMIVQALWDNKSPLLQLPYVQEEHLKHLKTKKHHIKSVQQFAQLKLEDKRSVLKFLKDEQFENVVKVVSKMPQIDFQVRCEVIDDEATNVITAGAIVTVTVVLKRRNLCEAFGNETFKDKNAVENCEKGQQEREEKADKIDSGSVRQKRQCKMKKSKKLGTKKNGNPTLSKKEKDEKTNGFEKNCEQEEISGTDIESSSCDEEETENTNEQKKLVNNKPAQENLEEDNDDDWRKFQSKFNKKNILDARSKKSHPVHCPFFPEVKQEYWWVYISDRKSRTLLTPPYQVTDLVDYDEIQLKFTAPRWPGIYTFAVCLRSDSYLGFDQMQEIQMDIKEAPNMPTKHPQWDMSSEEDDESETEDNDDGISEFATDEDVED